MPANDSANSRSDFFLQQRLDRLEAIVAALQQRFDIPALIAQQREIYSNLHDMTIQQLKLCKVHTDRSVPRIQGLMELEAPPAKKDGLERMMETLGVIMGMVTEMQGAASPQGGEVLAKLAAMEAEVASMRAAANGGAA